VKKIVKIGEVAVDSGTVWCGDPCYLWDEGTAQQQIGDWSKFCDALEATPHPQYKNFGTLGVAATSGLGDGRYPVYAAIENGVILSLTVQFLSDDEEEEK
jgi:hypothetical protein